MFLICLRALQNIGTLRPSRINWHFVHTETLIKKYMDNFQSEDSYHSNGTGKGKGKANHTETGHGKGGRARSQSADTKDHADEDVGYTPERRGSEPNVKPTSEADRKANGNCPKFYQTGKCWFGNKCKFEHVAGPDVASESTNSVRSAPVSKSSNKQDAQAIRKRLLQLKKEQVKAQKELSKLEGQTLHNTNHDDHADKASKFTSHTDSRHVTRQAEPQNVEDQLVNHCRKHIVPKAAQETDVPQNVVHFPQ